LQQELVRLVRWRRTPEEQHHPHVLDVRRVPENDRHAATERDLAFGVSRMTVCGGSSPESLPISRCVIEPRDSNISNSGMLLLGSEQT
jgi:hypothetical protein